ncbi:MAG: DUF992 domain-containing protein [Alphaproteobacteria bacterium]|nr:DUF992 domain-containing protein [Alphaproteobacteria bacterium]
MRRNSRIGGFAAAAALGAVTLASPAHAQVQAGVLACNVGGGWGGIIGSSRPVACTFSGPGGIEHYTGTLSQLGVDLGYLDGAHLVWHVVAPTAYPAPGSLAGQYTGVSGSAAVGFGGGAHVLVGGSQRSFSLQPVSFRTQGGLNVQAGLSSLTLQPAA